MILHINGQSVQLAQHAVVTERGMKPFWAGNELYCNSDTLRFRTGSIRLIGVDRKAVRELFPDSEPLVADLTYSQHGYPAIMSSATLTLPATIDTATRGIGDVLMNYEYRTQQG